MNSPGPPPPPPPPPKDMESGALSRDFPAQNYNTVEEPVGPQPSVKQTRAERLARIKAKGSYTVDEIVEYIGMGPYHWIWLSFFGISSMAQAVEITLNSIILTELGCEWDLSSVEEVIIPALTLLMSVPGDIVGGILADTYGRYPVLVGGQIIISVFGVLSACVSSYAEYLIIRSIVGFGFGLIVFLIIVQVAEICPTDYRATAVAITFVFWTLGNQYIIGGGYWLQSDYGWRYVVLWAALPCVIMMFIQPFADESPKYCIVSGDPDKAVRICG
eukprot:sb/3468080/